MIHLRERFQARPGVQAQDSRKSLNCIPLHPVRNVSKVPRLTRTYHSCQALNWDWGFREQNHGPRTPLTAGKSEESKETHVAPDAFVRRLGEKETPVGLAPRTNASGLRDLWRSYAAG